MGNRAEHLFRQAAANPDATAIVFEGHTISFADLANRVRKTAGGLAEIGIAQGNHVGLWLPSTPDFIVMQQSLFLLGTVVTPINIQYRPSEVRHAIECCQLAWIITTEEFAQTLTNTLSDRCPVRIITMDTHQDTRSFASLPVAASKAHPRDWLVPVNDDDVVMLLLTSATTGKAKGVMLTSGNLAANYDQTPRWLGLDQDTVILCALPLYNTFGLNQGINAMLVTGCTMVLLPRFDTEQCIQAIHDYQCSFVPAVPTMLQKMIDHPGATKDALSSLRGVMTGGAPVPSALLRRLLDLAPDVEVLTGYGLTEATALVTLTRVRLGPGGQVERDRTIGRVLDGMDLTVIDEGGKAVGPGIAGEILVRGPNLMAGYLCAPEATGEILSQGWLRTGDIGYLDIDGYAYIVDRKKDVIIRGGQNIYPADIEEVLYQFPGVSEAAVVSRPDPILGEVPIAYLALKAGSSPDVASMLEHCRVRLASYKCPVAIEVLPELPKGPTGKILRRALRGALVLN
ncbi:long-chain-fatty-acid--CoA ligase [Novosphingobium sp. Rr 2-17]|uniref:class I adenylate-forming enzyme family protein n=1 Tax=Novosphingobium sp. Rr 2-17 TaxID=555793 RepID=UPI000269ABA8|nr:AMP-binding protein [Novosphingobium sp. Rr 2-17]EIZ77835.1 long-chain-fatty-acid--CoA ligase [Novosphingobium sp. Rr 2-17]